MKPDNSVIVGVKTSRVFIEDDSEDEEEDSDSTLEGVDTAESTTEKPAYRIDHEILNHRIR